MIILTLCGVSSAYVRGCGVGVACIKVHGTTSLEVSERSLRFAKRNVHSCVQASGFQGGVVCERHRSQEASQAMFAR